MTDDAPYTTADRYAKAVHSSDLTPGTERVRTDADVLIAAGAATAKDEKRQLALAAYRLGLAGDTTGLGPLVDAMDDWLLTRLSKGGNRAMPEAARRQLIVDSLRWWFNPACGYCNGAGYVVVDGASRLSTIECTSCHGTKKRPLRREVPRPYVEHAEWLTDELNRLVSIVFGDMARMLNGKMDEAVGK